jgi:hypothetical protein
MLPVANVAENHPVVMFCIHIFYPANVFYNIKQQKKKKVRVNVAKNTDL